MAASSSSRVLVYGGKGALGASIVNYFKAKDWVNAIVLVLNLLHVHYVCMMDVVGVMCGFVPK